jgi:hypothetical protein
MPRSQSVAASVEAVVSADDGAAAPPRSLADDLRRRTDPELGDLLRLRADLLHPVPADLRALATRATTAPSVLRALDGFDTFGLGVVELIATDERAVSVDSLADELDALLTEAGLAHRVEAGRHQLPAVVERLRTIGLLWGLPDQLHLVRTARDAVRGALTNAPEDVDLRTRACTHLAAVEPPDVLDAPVRDRTLVDNAAAQAAIDTVRLVDALLTEWSTAPPPVLRAGGVGVRDLARAADALDLVVDHAAFIIELAAAAGLVADDGAADPVFAPTERFDDWSNAELPERWAAITIAWFRTPRAAGLIGARDAKDQRIAALSSDLERSSAASVRRVVLGELAVLESGTAPSLNDVHARIEWRRPRRATPLRHDLIEWTVREAAWLGVTGVGALSSAGAALLSAHEVDTDGPPTDPGDDPAIVMLAQALQPMLPAPVDHVIVQPDLTAVAPGPLTPALARELGVLADIESTGGATVYRFTEQTLRRGFDDGRDAEAIKGFLADVSLTPIPQPLLYLIDDLARRHGAVRIGAASAYVRCDDAETMAVLLSSRTAQVLQLRRLAPTVAISPVAGPTVLERLTEAGFNPALEGGDGVLLLRRPQPHRARPLSSASGAVRSTEQPPSERLLEVAVRALRNGEDGGRVVDDTPVTLTRPLPPRATPSKLLALLRSAVADGAALRIGYAGSDGSTAEHLIDPVRVSGGQLTAYDHRSGDVRGFTVSRITGVEVLTSPAAVSTDVSSQEDA